MMSQQDGEGPRPGLVTGVSTFEKAAQGGHGFQTVGVDLGVLGSRGNVDEEMRRQGSASSGISGGGSRSSSSHHDSHYSSGVVQTGSSSSGFSKTHSSQDQGAYLQHANENADDDYEDEIEYDDHDQDQRGSAGGGSPSSHLSSYPISHKRPLNAHPERVDQQFKHYPTKREIKDPICKSTHCVSVRCVVGPLKNNEAAQVAFRTRLVARTLDKVWKMNSNVWLFLYKKLHSKIGGESEVKLSTMAFARITKLPFVGEPTNDTTKAYEVFVTATPDPIPKSDVVPLWIVVLAACAGALILLLLIYLLYKVRLWLI
jgi:integrin alpha 8